MHARTTPCTRCRLAREVGSSRVGWCGHMHTPACSRRRVSMRRATCEQAPTRPPNSMAWREGVTVCPLLPLAVELWLGRTTQHAGTSLGTSTASHTGSARGRYRDSVCTSTPCKKPARGRRASLSVSSIGGTAVSCGCIRRLK